MAGNWRRKTVESLGGDFDEESFRRDGIVEALKRKPVNVTVLTLTIRRI
jgi:gamma-glutamyl-gamma-aminobutyrate hydrolase PuuD